jgi:hypothetical protein
VIEKIVSWEKNGLFHSHIYLPFDITLIANRDESKRKKLTLVAYDDDIERQNKSGKPLIPLELRKDVEGQTQFKLSTNPNMPLYSAQKMFWDPTGKLLAVLLTDLKNKTSVVLVYNRSNFSWCLKLRRNLNFIAKEGWFLDENRVTLLGAKGEMYIILFEWIYQIGEYSLR